MKIVAAIREFVSLLRRVWLWVLFYIGAGCLLILFGNVLEDHKVISTTLVSIGGSFLAIGLVTVLVEVNTSWHVLKILQMYGDYKEHGLYRVFADDGDHDYKQLYDEKRTNAKDIKVLSLLGRTFLENEDKIEQTLNMIRHADKCMLLFSEIGGHGYKYRYKNMEPMEDGDVAGLSRAELFHRKFETLRSKVAELNSPHKIVKPYKTLPVFHLEFYDKFLFVSFYGFRSRAKNRSPILVFEKRSDSKVYGYFEQQFEEYCCKSHGE